jgi:ATP-dependent Clp protease ATP-binding subunit ClpX
LNRQAVGYSTSKNVDNIDKDNLLQYIIPKDIKDFGLIPEIIGRLPVLTLIHEEKQSYFDTAKKCFDQTIHKLFIMDDVEFTISMTRALDFIVDKV